LASHPRLGELGELDIRVRAEQEMNATNQKNIMDFTGDTSNEFWDVYKGESFDIWNPEKGKIYARIDPKKATDFLQQRRLRSRVGVHSEYPLEIINDPNTLLCFSPRLTYRRIARGTDMRCLIPALIPANVVLSDVAPAIHFIKGTSVDMACLLGVLSCVVSDWYVKRFAETHVDFHIFDRIPIPNWKLEKALAERLSQLAGRLACPDERFADWATAVGVDYGLLDPDDKQDKIHELDAVVAHLYGLSEPQLVHIFETFHEGWHYEARLNEVLKHYHAWAGKA
jgi:hypothetical protein